MSKRHHRALLLALNLWLGLDVRYNVLEIGDELLGVGARTKKTECQSPRRLREPAE